MAKHKVLASAVAAVAFVVGVSAGVDAQVVDVTPPTVGVTSSSPLISPNNDGRLDRVTLRITVDEPVALTVRLTRPGRVASRTLAAAQAVSTGTTNLVWNGRLRRPDGSWVRAADGRVDIAVDAVDLATNASSRSSHVTIDTHPPVVRLHDVSPEPWSGRGVLHQLFDTRDPSHPLTMWAQVLDGDRLVDEMDHHARPSDTNLLSWLPQAGHEPLEAGAYRAVVVVRDAAGNTGRSATRPFRVHRSGSTFVIRQVEGAGPRVGLTIDDCADEAAWRSMLDTLDRMDAGATFFCNGNNVRRWPDLARRTAAMDRVSIGSHSTDHADLTTLDYGGVLGRLLGDESAWWDVAHTTPAPWFRPPYGNINSTVLAAAGAASFPFTVLWSIDPQDWEAPDAGTVVSRAVGKATSGRIILIHVKPLTAQALPSIIGGLRSRGLEPVGLPELTGHR